MLLFNGIFNGHMDCLSIQTLYRLIVRPACLDMISLSRYNATSNMKLKELANYIVDYIMSNNKSFNCLREGIEGVFW